MKKRFLLSIGILLISYIGMAQRQNTHWYFGLHAHVKFDATGNLITAQGVGEAVPVNSTFNQLVLEGCATVSDYVTGDLLLYSNGYAIYGSNHVPITNGIGLNGNPSSTQNVVFVPKPKNNRIYYAITIDGFSGGSNGLFYSEINATTATPSIISGIKNIPLKDNFGIPIDQSYNSPNNSGQLNQSESITVVKHSNGVDYWLVAHVNNFIYVYLVDCNGIGGVNNNPFTSYSIVANNPMITYPELGGAMKISQTDKLNERLAIVLGDNGFSAPNVMAGSFNRANGSIVLDTTVAAAVPGAYSLEFSKNGDVLYFKFGQQIRSFNFLTNQSVIVAGANALLSNVPIINADTSFANFFNIQRATNDNIYVSIHNNRFLGIINNSNDSNTANYVSNITGNLLPFTNPNFTTSLIGLPQLVPQQVPYIPPTLVANADSFTLSNASTLTTTQTVLQANPTNPDTMNGTPAVLTGTPNLVVNPVVGSLNPVPTSGGIILNTNGTLTVQGGTTSGTYTLQYSLCTAGSCPVFSNVTTVTVVVVNAFNPGLGADQNVLAITLQEDNKIIIGGMFTRYDNVPRNKIARLNTDLSLDTTFDVGTGLKGTATPDDVNAFVESSAIQKINNIEYVIAGGQFAKYNDVSLNAPLVRILPNGSRDLTFVTPTINGSQVTYNNTGLFPYNPARASIKAIVVCNDGKIIIAGLFTLTDGTNVRHNIARLNANGSLDTSFNHIYNYPYTKDGSYFTSIKMQSNKILVGGRYVTSNNLCKGIIRLNNDGALDTTFNDNNFITFMNTFFAIVESFDVSPITNNILISGGFDSYHNQPNNSISLINSDGFLVSGFNSGSGFYNGSYGSGSSVNFVPDGSSFYVGGYYASYNGSAINGISKIKIDGTLDATFNPRLGYVDSDGFHQKGSVKACKLQPDGKLIIGGRFDYYNNNLRGNITRLIPSITGGEGKISIENNSIEEIILNSEFKVYPNPSSGTININLGEFKNEQFSLKLYNLLGQDIFAKQIITNDDDKIDISNLEKGNYFLVLTNEKRIIKRLIIKN